MGELKVRNWGIQTILYASSLLIPVLLLISGTLFLYFNHSFVFGYTPITGFSITLGILLISSALAWFTIRILRNKVPLKKKTILQIAHGGLAIIGICGIIFGFLSANLFISAIRYTTGPILTWATDQEPMHEITIMWRTRYPELYVVHYGNHPNNLNETISYGFPDEWHRVALMDLEPDTTYYYQVGKSAKIYDFTTAPSIEKNFTFLLFSDPRQNTSPINVLFKPNVPKFMMKTMESDGIDIAFTINAGDITHQADMDATWKSWFDDISEKSGLASYAPLQIAIGNHERQGDCSANIFSSYYPYDNKPGFFYSYNYSSTHIQVLDPYNYTSCHWGGLDPVQLAWAHEDLQRAASMKYKIIALHPPPLYHSYLNKDLLDLITLCDTYDVDAVFYGHIHDYETTIINGTYFCLIGVGGNDNKSGNPPGFCQVDVSSSEMKIAMRWINGTNELIGIIPA